MSELRYLNDGSVIWKNEDGIYAHEYKGSLPLFMGKSDGEELFNNGKEMKVFKMDDSSWVAHFSEEEAIEFYTLQVDVDENYYDEYFEGEVSLKDTMLWEESSISQEDIDTYGFEKSPFNDDYYNVTFDWAIKKNPFHYPYWVACGDY